MHFFNSLQPETDQETESDKESVQNSSFGRTSFGRSILHALDERSLFNKKVYKELMSMRYYRLLNIH